MTQREFEQAMAMRGARMDDLAVSGYGDRAYGTPEETIWNDAFERARVRIANPRWEGLGTVPGGLDSPENVGREVFQPVLEAFEPQMAVASEVARNRTGLDLERQSIMRDQQERLRQELELKRITESRVAANKAKEQELKDKIALNNFNLKSRSQTTPRTKSQEYAIKMRMRLAMDNLGRAQRENDETKIAAAMAEMDSLESQLPGMTEDAASPMFAPEMPSFVHPGEVAPPTFQHPGNAPAVTEAPSFPVNPARVTTAPAPAAAQAGPQMTKAQVDQLRAEAWQSVRRKGYKATAALFKRVTGEDL
jgi:hypothetical protein